MNWRMGGYIQSAHNYWVLFSILLLLIQSKRKFQWLFLIYCLIGRKTWTPLSTHNPWFNMPAQPGEPVWSIHRNKPATISRINKPLSTKVLLRSENEFLNMQLSPSPIHFIWLRLTDNLSCVKNKMQTCSCLLHLKCFIISILFLLLSTSQSSREGAIHLFRWLLFNHFFSFHYHKWFHSFWERASISFEMSVDSIPLSWQHGPWSQAACL